MQLRHLFIGLIASIAFGACGPDDAPPIEEPITIRSLTNLPYAPEAYTYKIPDHFQELPQPDSNIATVAGVELGRRLFYDPILSRDSSISCASCHLPASGFTDQLASSPGIIGEKTLRSSMSLANIAYQSSYFWDGRSATLEEQSLHPVEDPIEMDATWPEIEDRLRNSEKYNAGFRAAFGIENTGEIDRYLAAKAIAQFERAIISGNSRYDQITFELNGFFTQLEEDGRELFFTEPSLDHPGCAHCHNAPLFADNRFLNNGIDSSETLEGFSDLGRGAISGNPFDNGKFRSPSLRNIEVTGPYMHDGRFETLDEVLDHYASGGHYSPTIDPQVTGFPLSDYEREAMKAFLLTLTDTASLTIPELSDPG
jgi:cytochrome c peroxidase